jgi:hypothetical protein
MLSLVQRREDKLQRTENIARYHIAKVFLKHAKPPTLAPIQQCGSR